MKTWDAIFFASCRRGDDPCYAMFLADEYVKRARPMTDSTADNRDHTTKDAILTYLRCDDQPCELFAIKRYMEQMFRVSHGATREQIYRLCRAGLVERTGRAQYRMKTGLDA